MQKEKKKKKLRSNIKNVLLRQMRQDLKDLKELSSLTESFTVNTQEGISVSHKLFEISKTLEEFLLYLRKRKYRTIPVAAIKKEKQNEIIS